ncbi:HNH endonuclease signature motif containing protein [Spirulina sp. 06S082]|uniref:HNH endonuclease n=1 Tax=Spirulina sp. 06S082 TaxID=3110248 RepID=UPI002B2024CB|nr:HNH endonuclease signature motif containing protein [Spirulina sp. 06S082]MEA5467723.1 HNH endonuclease signature motif containing protein [Spirulina sp. 06S082]
MSKSSISSKIKQIVAERANQCCEYCQSQLRYSPDPFSIEHIIPVIRGGTSNLDNLALSCQGCNNRKYTSIAVNDPVTGEMVALYNPRQHQWQKHFTWTDNYSQLLGRSPIGRVTVEKLQLNREGVVNLRKALRSLNEHPPNFKE